MKQTKSGANPMRDAELQSCRIVVQSMRRPVNPDGLSWARRIVGRHNAGERIAPLTLKIAREALARQKGRP